LDFGPGQSLDQGDSLDGQELPRGQWMTSSPETKGHSWTVKKNAGAAKSTEVTGVKAKTRTAEKMKGSLQASTDLEGSDRQLVFDGASPPTFKKGSVQQLRALHQRGYERRSECRLAGSSGQHLN
jgi:hypothetical protein